MVIEKAVSLFVCITWTSELQNIIGDTVMDNLH